MLKEILNNDTEYTKTEKGIMPRKAASLSAIPILIFISITVGILFFTIGFGETLAVIAEGFLSLEIIWCILLIIFVVIVYILLVGLFLQFFCDTKWQSIKFRILEDVQLPTCSCGEALKPAQVIFAFVIPLILTRFPLLAAAVITGNFVCIFSLLILVMLSGIDMILVIYISVLNIAGDVNYITVNNHVFSLTLYKKNKK